MNEYEAPFPHCDSLVLHAPGECVYCDKYPAMQALRQTSGVNFTGHGGDPATERRSLEVIEKWYGNVPKTQEDIDAEAAFWANLRNAADDEVLF